MKISASDRSALLGIIERFPRQHIVLLGDLVADEFIHAEIARVSREAPVLILKQREKRIAPGGGGNAANNLVELGAKLTLAGVVGDDESGEVLLDYFRQKRVATGRVVRLRGYLTPTKSRVLGVLAHGHPQQIVRLDREPAGKVERGVRRRLTQSVLAALSGASALLIADYGYGATNAAEVELLRRRVRKMRGRSAGSLPITLDSRYDLLSYFGMSAATPNEPEIEEALGKRIGNSTALLHRLGQRVLRRQSFEALLVTRGREGMVLFEPRRPPQHLPVFGSDQVADVTGAGDTVIAAFTLALAAGASFLHAAMLANCAGGLVVMKSGTATATGRELAEAIRNA
jgi:D-glycero-beta-D-manno-heptose-7-phosphate kinase